MPRFTYSYGASLTSELKALGLAAAFAPTANLSGMCMSACWVSDVRHTTFIHVDEKGTVATGVTTIGFGGGARPTAQVHMMINRPFALAIRDGQSGAILFLGAVRTPAA